MHRVSDRPSVDAAAKWASNIRPFSDPPTQAAGSATAETLDMPREARTEGGCTGHGPVHGREAGASPGARARDVTKDVALLVAAVAEVAAQ